MTRISQILAIVVTVASLAFMGFAIVATVAGPDWPAMMDHPDFAAYAITQTEDQNPVWVARSQGGGQLVSSKRLSDVIIKVQDDILANQQRELTSLNQREPAVKSRIDQLKESITADAAALQRYTDQQRSALAAVIDQERTTAQEVIRETGEAQKLENAIASRRDDVFRLNQQVQELIADHYRLEQIRTQLQNLIWQTEGTLDRALERKNLLQSQLSQ